MVTSSSQFALAIDGDMGVTIDMRIIPGTLT
jgi:hypothetical protein